eukprot:245276-Pelagomonas_calceolata.AAC.3
MFFSYIVDMLFLAGMCRQAEQPNYLAKGLCHCNLEGDDLKTSSDRHLINLNPFVVDLGIIEYIHLDIPKDILRIVARLHLWDHTHRLEKAAEMLSGLGDFTALLS